MVVSDGPTGFAPVARVATVSVVRRTIPMLLVLIVAAVAVGVATAVIGDPQLVSLDNTGVNRTGDALGSAVSADGRWVAFTSRDNLTGTPTAGVKQLYVRDMVGGRTALASAGATGAAADADVDDPTDHRAYAISGDGRYVVFATGATNLVTGDHAGADHDVFRKDLQTGAIALVSRATSGAAANGAVGGDPDISYDGSKVTYETGTAINLWAGDTSAASDIVVSDLVAGTSVLASANAMGASLPGPISQPVISADGRVVAFEDGSMITVRNLVAASTTVGLATGAFPDLSGDGHVVAFQNAASIVRRDLVTATSTTIANGTLPGLSADGRRVAFEAPASQPDDNGVPDVYVGGPAGPLERVSQRGDGTGVTRESNRPAISADGGSVAFNITDGGPAPTLNSADTNGFPDVLVAKLPPTDTTGPTLTVSSPAGGASVTTATIGVSGAASDPSGVVSVTVDGYPALLGSTNSFSMEVPLAVGAGTLTVRAVDGAGRVSERLVAITRAGTQSTRAARKARARSLRVYRAGRATRVRFVLDAGATRVTIRLWRRVVHPLRAPTWTPVKALRKAAATRGRRTALVSPRPLRPGIYQVRVTVISPGGVAVDVIRHPVARRRN